MLSLFVSVLILLFGVASGLTREYINVSIAKNWTDALLFCRLHYKDLAVVTTDQENHRIHELIGKNYTWIGMYRASPNVSLWLWSNRTPSSYYQWDIDQPNNMHGKQNCVEVMPEGWNDQFCYLERFFLCYRFLVLVKEKKTWEEAFHYCRMNYTGLASMASDTKLQLAEMESNNAQTYRIWTGLTFLNGKWVWVSGEPLGKLVSLPSCPDQRYRCGALNNKTHHLENRDCNEKLNFFCYY